MTLLLTQMSIILLVAVNCGRVARKVGQARVVGEIVGGILIGPSVFGRFAPHISASLFPPSSFTSLETLSTGRTRPFPFSDWNGTRLYPALPATRDCCRRQRHEHPSPFRDGSFVGAL